MSLRVVNVTCADLVGFTPDCCRSGVWSAAARTVCSVSPHCRLPTDNNLETLYRML